MLLGTIRPRASAICDRWTMHLLLICFMYIKGRTMVRWDSTFNRFVFSREIATIRSCLFFFNYMIAYIGLLFVIIGLSFLTGNFLADIFIITLLRLVRTLLTRSFDRPEYHIIDWFGIGLRGCISFIFIHCTFLACFIILLASLSSIILDDAAQERQRLLFYFPILTFFLKLQQSKRFNLSIHCRFSGNGIFLLVWLLKFKFFIRLLNHYVLWSFLIVNV